MPIANSTFLDAFGAGLYTAGQYQTIADNGPNAQSTLTAFFDCGSTPATAMGADEYALLNDLPLPTITVGLVLDRINDVPDDLLTGTWADRQATLAGLDDSGTLWSTYGRPADLRRPDPLRHRRPPIPIKCAVGRLNFNHGTVTFDRTLLDTQRSVLHVQGQASLISQAVKAEVDADAKQFDLLDLHGAVIVQGKLREPQISLGRIFLIPTPVIGTAKDVACPQVTQQLFSGQ